MVFHISELEYYHIKFGLGITSNNHAKMMGLKIIFMESIEKYVSLYKFLMTPC